MKLFQNPILLFSAACLLSACTKVPNGFLSNIVRYEEDPVIINKGVPKVSSALNFDGSSKPTTITVVHYYDSAGTIVDDLFQKQYDVIQWSAAFDPRTDTTLEQIAAKQYNAQAPAVRINPSSGQVETNFQTLNIPNGDYWYDLQITNPSGTKLYPKIGHLRFADPVYFQANADLGSPPYNRLFKVGDESQVRTIAVPVVTVTRSADSPNMVVLKFVDKNGVPFNPKAGEIVRRPGLQIMADYALKPVQYFDDRMEFSFGLLPFPFASLGNGFNIYYRIPAPYFKADDPAYAAGEWSANPRFAFRAFIPGKYEIVVMLPDVTHS